MKKSIQLSQIGPRNVRPLVLTPEQVQQYHALANIGISFVDHKRHDWAMDMAEAFGMDDVQGGLTAPSIATPVQFLQAWLPGFVRVITAARKIDELVGISTIGKWSDEEIVQGVLENLGLAQPYGDYTNIPFASWNTNFERRTIVRFELGSQVGVLEAARSAEIRVDSSGEKRTSTMLNMEIARNLVGFYGYNQGNNRTYGFLNDPALPAYVNVPAGGGGTLWSQKTFLEICADIRMMAAMLQTQSQDNINPESTEITLALPTNSYQYLSVISDYGISVREWVSRTYPKMRIVSAPQLNDANGGDNVAYMYAEAVDDNATDDSRTWLQCVPAKFQALGVEKRAKSTIEDYTNATAGVMLKRPYAVVRVSGI